MGNEADEQLKEVKISKKKRRRQLNNFELGFVWRSLKCLSADWLTYSVEALQKRAFYYGHYASKPARHGDKGDILRKSWTVRTFKVFGSSGR